MADRFNPSSSQAARAVQAWQVLIGHAMNRQTLTYELLSRLMYQKDAAGVLAHVLGHVAYFCIDHDLPPLTSIVVNKRRGSPGQRIPVDLSSIDEQRELVYGFDWYDVYPPSAEDLRAAWERHGRELPSQSDSGPDTGV